MTLVDLLRERSSGHGDRTAYIFLEDGFAEGPAITYGGLDEKARAIAARLQEVSQLGERALLLYPAGLDFLAGFFGCLYAGVIGIPTPPPEAMRLKRTGPRLRSIAEDAQISLVLTTAKIRALIEQSNMPIFEGRPIRWLATDEFDPGAAGGWREPSLSGETLAYLQYTSGSTSTPKGVMIGHGNLTFHAAQLQKACGYTPDSVTVTWMPNFHDYGLVEGLIEPLFNATPCYVMSPFAFVKRPVSWLRAITRYRGTHSQAPNFAYDLCVRRVGPEQREGLDLRSWRAAGNAAELINPRVLEAFHDAFAPFGFRKSAMCPAYGLAEATLLVSTTPQGEEPVVARLRAAELENHRVVEADDSTGPVRAVVSCGRVFPTTRLAVVDPVTGGLCDRDQVGELWVSDPAVAQGYWRRPEETEETFRGRVAGTSEGPFLRTGDLGFLKDGHLFIAGRLKDTIIIRGANHHPQDIEWTVQAAHSALRPENGAAFSVLVDGEEKLVVAQEVEREHAAGLRAGEVARVVRQAVAEAHDLDLFGLLLLTRGSLPKTASGKIQRQSCREFYLRGGPQILTWWIAPTCDPAVLPAWLAEMPAEAGSACPKAALPDRPSSASGMTPGLVAHPPVRVTPVPGDVSMNNGIASMVSAEVSRSRANDLIGWLRRYASDRINSRLMDERRCIPPYLILDFGNQGILGMPVPESYGGLGLRFGDYLRVLEQLAAIDLTLALVLFANSTNGIRPIQRYARPALRDELLPRLASGRELAAFALSEPGAGSNLGGIASQALPDGRGGWRLRGLKRWNASSWAGVVSVFVRLPGERGRPGGLTGFVVRQGSPGLRVGPEALTTGLRGSVQNSLYLDDVPVGPEQLLGEPGRGMEVAEDTLTLGRLCISALSLGGLKRCVQLLTRYGSRRTIASGQLLANPLVLTTLGEMVGLIGALEALRDQIARRLDTDQPVPPEVPMAAKVIGTDGLVRAGGQLVQLLGGRGFMENNLAPQILRDARGLTITEGSNEPLTTQVGRKARHTSAIGDYLRTCPEGDELADLLASSGQAIVARCLDQSGPFADRSTAQLWADTLNGRVASDTLLLAAAREANHRSPSAQSRRSLDWAELRLARTLQRALEGSPEERLIPTPDDIAGFVSTYADSIGDVEQTLAGEEDTLDPLLTRTPGFDPYPPLTDLPGHAAVPNHAIAASGRPDPVPGGHPSDSLAARAKTPTLGDHSVTLT
jgi:acyl-CoA synthetase (AMP-forming)/AMP-acid ligase II/alkylation response protein AidB-like acyl-CoA dehydrogenase